MFYLMVEVAGKLQRCGHKVGAADRAIDRTLYLMVRGSVSRVPYAEVWERRGMKPRMASSARVVGP